MSDDYARLKAALCDRYAIERELGSGGMATVYLAQDLKHHRMVALKVLRPEVGATLGADRFIREIQIAARLTHPHIVPLYDSGRANGLLYYVMPYIQGESLRERLDQEGGLSVEEALKVTREVAAALAHAHVNNVIHRDIKPENILFSGGEAVVTDFGIARAISAAGGSGITHSGLPLGTLGYMSPEQAMGRGELDARTDIYSLGCVLYEMVVGQPPGIASDEESASTGRWSRRSAEHRRRLDAIPAGLEATLIKALALEPADRFSSAIDFAAALESANGRRRDERFHRLADVGAYLMFGIVAILLTYVLIGTLGLPDWALHGIAVLLLAGAVITAVRPAWLGAGGFRSARLGWRRTVKASSLALGAWGGLVAVYMTLRFLGIGSTGTLVASGMIAERDPVILADFAGRNGDSLLADAVTEALRIDLAQSPVVYVVEPERVQTTLAMMQWDPGAPLDAELAREVALRSGYKAVIAGEIIPAGSGFILSARIVSAEDGRVLVAHREAAIDSNAVIDAIDRLSNGLRERVGESLRSVRASEPLEQVSTVSLDALRSYSLALRAARRGDPTTARSLLREAVHRDTTFAMAYRKLGMYAETRSEQVEVLEKAVAHQDRLSERERYLTLGTYYTVATYERERAIAVYRTMLDVYPDDYGALTNLGWLYSDLRDFDRALDLFQRAYEIDSLSWSASNNLAFAQFAVGEFGAARSTLESFIAREHDHPNIGRMAALLPAANGDYDAAERAMLELRDEQRGSLFWRSQLSYELASLALVRGRLGAAEEHIRTGMQAAEELDASNAVLQGMLMNALIDIWYREDVSAGIRTIEEALSRYTMHGMEPLDRPYITVAMLFAMAGRPESARRLLEEFEAAVPSDLRRAAARDCHEILGLIALAENRPADAAAEFRQADEGPCPICMLPMIGLAHYMMGDVDSTIAIYERYISTPWIGRIGTDVFALARIHERLGELYSERGDTDRAIEHFGRLVELWQNADPELRPRVETARAAIRSLAADHR